MSQIPDRSVAHSLANSLRVLNVADVVATFYLVTYRGAEELNPIAAALIGVSPLLFAFVKIVLVGLCAELLALRNRVGLLAAANLFYLLAVAAHAACLFGDVP